MGQFIDASIFFKDGLEVLEQIPENSRRNILEIGQSSKSTEHGKCIMMNGATWRLNGRFLLTYYMRTTQYIKLLYLRVYVISKYQNVKVWFKIPINLIVGHPFAFHH